MVSLCRTSPATSNHVSDPSAQVDMKLLLFALPLGGFQRRQVVGRISFFQLLHRVRVLPEVGVLSTFVDVVDLDVSVDCSRDHHLVIVAETSAEHLRVGVAHECVHPDLPVAWRFHYSGLRIANVILPGTYSTLTGWSPVSSFFVFFLYVCIYHFKIIAVHHVIC